jgi:hypothetical protein
MRSQIIIVWIYRKRSDKTYCNLKRVCGWNVAVITQTSCRIVHVSNCHLKMNIIFTFERNVTDAKRTKRRVNKKRSDKTCNLKRVCGWNVAVITKTSCRTVHVYQTVIWNKCVHNWMWPMMRTRIPIKMLSTKLLQAICTLTAARNEIDYKNYSKQIVSQKHYHV